MITVYYTYANNEVLPTHVLSEYRKKRVQGSAKNSQLGVVAELLLIYALKEGGVGCSLPLSIVQKGQGKPYLADGTEFSLSHTNGLACAVVGSNLGLDCEMLREVKPIGNLFMQSDEVLLGNSSESNSLRFLRHWTAKESCLKAVGLGIGSIKSVKIENSVGKVADKVFPLWQFLLPMHIITLAGANCVQLAFVPIDRLKEIV